MTRSARVFVVPFGVLVTAVAIHNVAGGSVAWPGREDGHHDPADSVYSADGVFGRAGIAGVHVGPERVHGGSTGVVYERAGFLARGGAHGRAPAGSRGRKVHESGGGESDTAFLMLTADNCVACHNSLIAPSGEDISIGSDWRASIMANSARDPYWQAAVRREMIDHPRVADEIQEECTRCHMPMLNVEQRARGERPLAMRHLPIRDQETRLDSLAADGVSCALCHRITADRLGTRESFTGGYVIDSLHVVGHGRVFGPFDVDSGRARIMRSATTFQPTEAAHIQTSEPCATCHTLFREIYDENDEVIALHPEQTPYLEWVNSDFRGVQSCQDCHMQVVRDSAAITSVLAQPRPNVNRHWFIGGNFFILRMLNRYREELGVAALPHELDDAIQRTVQFLQTETARVSVEYASLSGDVLEADIIVENLTGHKLPTAYPSRRAWLHVTVQDGRGDVAFESGALRPDGSIVGNANDDDPAFYELHHEVIDSPEEVQIYEPIMVAPDGSVTTGLTTGIRYIKENRLLPRGFDKAGASDDIAVYGRAAEDVDFVGGGDRVRYRARLGGAPGPYRVVATLWYQPISFRWANNLRPYDAVETNRFLRYFDEMSEYSAVALARTETVVQ